MANTDEITKKINQLTKRLKTKMPEEEEIKVLTEIRDLQKTRKELLTK